MKDDMKMAAASLVWEGFPDNLTDMLQYMKPCPHCGELPEWERDGRFSPRWRLNCCQLNNHSYGELNGYEFDAIMTWNQVIEFELEALEWAKAEAEREAHYAEEDDAEEDVWANERV